MSSIVNDVSNAISETIISNFSIETRETLYDLALPIIVILGAIIGGAIAGSFLPGFGNAMGALAGGVTGLLVTGIGTSFLIGNKLEPLFFTTEEIAKRTKRQEISQLMNDGFSLAREVENLKNNLVKNKNQINKKMEILESKEKEIYKKAEEYGEYPKKEIEAFKERVGTLRLTLN